MSEESNDLKQDMRSIKRMLEDMDKRLGKLERRESYKEDAESSGGRPPFLKFAHEDKHEPREELHDELRKIKSHSSVETKITGTTFVVIGIISLLVGIAFFFKYLFENDIIGITGRIIIGIIVGIILLGIGHFLSSKAKYRSYSYFLSGGGLGVLYLSIYAAFNVYELIAQWQAFIFMIVITVVGSLLALKTKSKELAAMALLGGFITPFLVGAGTVNHLALYTYTFILSLGGVLLSVKLSRGLAVMALVGGFLIPLIVRDHSDQQILLFSYAFLLNLSFVFISYYEKWRELYFISFIGTYLIFAQWYTMFYTKAALGVTLLFLSLYFLCFLIAPFILSLVRKQKSDPKDAIASFINAAVYFGVAYPMLEADYHSVLGFFFVVWAVVYVIGAYLVSDVHKEDKNAVLTLGGVGLLLITLAIPVQLSIFWITIAWAVEGLILLWIGLYLKSYHIRVFSILVFIVAVIRLFAFDTFGKSLKEFTPILNERFAVFAVVIAALILAFYLYKKYNNSLRDDERHVSSVYGVVINFLFLFIFSLEIVDFFNKKASLLKNSINYRFTEVSLGGLDGSPMDKISSFSNARNLSLSLLWGAYASLLMIIGFWKHSRVARILSLILFGVVIIKVFIFDVSFLSDIYRIVSFIALGVILLVISFLFYYFKDKVKEFLS